MKGQLQKLPKIRLTIGTKLVTLIALLLMGSVVSLVWLATRMFIEDNTALIQQMNADTAAGLSTQVREIFLKYNEKSRMAGKLMLQSFEDPAARDQLLKELYSDDPGFIGAFLFQVDESGGATLLGRTLSPDVEGFNDPGGERALSAVNADKSLAPAISAGGAVQVSSVRMADGTPALAISAPFVKTGRRFSHTLTTLIRQARFAALFAESDLVTSFLVDSRGKLLAHTDAQRVLSGENLSYLGVVKQLLEGKFNNGQTRYVEPNSGEARLGAFHRVGFGGLAVVAEVAEAKAFEAAHRVEMRSIKVALIILCLSFLAGFKYSGTITWPVKQLVEAARKIAEGDFNIHLKPKSQDELGTLSVAFNEMAMGLEERDKVKETFNKFHNKEIAEKLLSGEVKLGGERKEATIFFSDVRGFTAMSETMEPEQVVEMLNEYMTRMVAIVRKNHGIVDKYVGDAIMALWGVPIPGPDDTHNAVKACLEMRQELAALNELRLSRGQNALKIGMGLNCGQVIAGNIGSNEKMEYTVIGDTVNTASRMESMTKEYGTDLLIPKVVRDKVEGKFVFEQCKSAKVKGKTQALEIFKVSGYVDEAGREVIVQTPYSSYASEKSDKVVHDEPKHEEQEEHEAQEASAAPAAQAAEAPGIAPLPGLPEQEERSVLMELPTASPDGAVTASAELELPPAAAPLAPMPPYPVPAAGVAPPAKPPVAASPAPPPLPPETQDGIPAFTMPVLEDIKAVFHPTAAAPSEPPSVEPPPAPTRESPSGLFSRKRSKAA